MASLAGSFTMGQLQRRTASPAKSLILSKPVPWTGFGDASSGRKTQAVALLANGGTANRRASWLWAALRFCLPGRFFAAHVA